MLSSAPMSFTGLIPSGLRLALPIRSSPFFASSPSSLLLIVCLSMAFRPIPQSAAAGNRPPLRLSPPTSQRLATHLPSDPLPAADEATEWILFSPSPGSADRSVTGTDRTPTRLSRLSDEPGSDWSLRRSLSIGLSTDHNAAIASSRQSADEDADSQADNLDQEADEEELDSLDDGLHAFEPDATAAPAPLQLQLVDQSALGILPAHDGLGSFQASSQPVQLQLYQHEQYNPRRRDTTARPPRRASVVRRLEAVEERERQYTLQQRQQERKEQLNPELERWKRIERWRVDQSQAVLEEIDKETRRHHRRAKLTAASASAASSSAIQSQSVSSSGTASTVGGGSSGEAAVTQRAEEPLWRRITRKVIQDIIGIDDSLLSVIFGESLPDNAVDPPLTRAEMDAEMRHVPVPPDREYYWQERFLQRIARELGNLVQQIYGRPAALGSYLRQTDDFGQQPPPQLTDKRDNTKISSSALHPETLNASVYPSVSQFSSAFKPTLQHIPMPGIDEEPSPTPAAHLSTQTRLDDADRDFWERDLDVSSVVRYLCARLTNSKSPLVTTAAAAAPALIPPTAPASIQQPERQQRQQARRGGSVRESSRRAEVIRQHHPLVARAHHHAQPRRPAPPLRRATMASSCAAENAKLSHGTFASSSNSSRSGDRSVRSARSVDNHQIHDIHDLNDLYDLNDLSISINDISPVLGPRAAAGGMSVSLSTESSRNYWDLDFGGSVGSGSAILAAPALGSTGGGSWQV